MSPMKFLIKIMKSYTDIEQSKRLAKILPLESADMCYPLPCNESDKPLLVRGGFGSTPCWSLAALIELIPDECRMEKTPLDQTGEFTYSFVDDYYNIRTYEEGNPVDACVEMIYKLKEKDLL